MRPVASALPLLLAVAVLVAGCSSPPPKGDGTSTTDTHGMTMAMGPDTYRMQLSGVPSAAMAPGHAFNVTVTAQMGPGMSMASHASDHIGAHFWNRTVSDPTANVGNATSCAHTSGDLPGSYTAACTAPAAPGTYRIRAHARITDADGTKHNWWSDEQTFTVA
jgi:hypothetical protein